MWLGGVPTKDAHLKPGRMTALQNPTSPGAPGGNRAWTFPGPACPSEFRLTPGAVKSEHGPLHTQLGLVLSVYTSPHLTIYGPLFGRFYGRFGGNFGYFSRRRGGVLNSKPWPRALILGVDTPNDTYITREVLKYESSPPL